MELLPIASRDMEHGTPCRCGSCGYTGRFDGMFEGKSEFDRAVFINSFNDAYECFNCFLK